MCKIFGMSRNNISSTKSTEYAPLTMYTLTHPYPAQLTHSFVTFGRVNINVEIAPVLFVCFIVILILSIFIICWAIVQAYCQHKARPYWWLRSTLLCLRTGWLLMSGVWMGWRVGAPCWLLAERNSRRAGEEGWVGDTLPSLSLDVDEGGVGGNVNPATTETSQQQTQSSCN